MFEDIHISMALMKSKKFISTDQGFMKCGVVIEAYVRGVFRAREDAIDFCTQTQTCFKMKMILKSKPALCILLERKGIHWGHFYRQICLIAN